MPKVVQLRELEQSESPKLYFVDNSGSGGGGDDVWRTSVENRLNTLHSDMSGLRGSLETKIKDVADKQDSHLRWTLGVFGAGFVIILGVVAQGFGWIGK